MIQSIKYKYIKTAFIKIKRKSIIYYLKIYYKKLLKIIIPKYERLFILEMDLRQFEGKSNQRKDIKIEIAKNIKEIESFIKKRKNWYYNHAKSLFEKGNICFVGKINNNIVSCLWANFNEAYFPIIEYLLHLNKDTVHTMDAYTLPEYRNMGIYNVIWNSCINYLKENEYTRIIGGIVPSNVRSWQVHKKLKLEHIIMKITLLKIFGFKKHFIKHIK